MEDTTKELGAREEPSGNASAEEPSSIEESQPKDPDEVAEPTDIVEDKDEAKLEGLPSLKLNEEDSFSVQEDSEAVEDKPADDESKTVEDKPADDESEAVEDKPADDESEAVEDKPADDESEAVEDKPTDDESTDKCVEEIQDTLSVDHSAEERDLLRQSAEERELQARDVSFCSESYDEDFLIMDEVHGDEDDYERESLAKAAESTQTGSTEKLNISTDAEGGNSRVEEKSDEEKSVQETEEKVGEAPKTMSTQQAGEAQVMGEGQVIEEYGSNDDVILEEQPPKPPVVFTMSDEEVSFCDPLKKEGKGNVDPGTSASEMLCEVNEEGVDSAAAESSDVEKAKKTSSEDADNEASQSSREAPVTNGSSAEDSQEGKVKKGVAECNGTSSSQLKRPLSPDSCTNDKSDAAKKIKCEAVPAPTDVKADIIEAAAVISPDKKFVVMTRSELEKYVNLQVQESLAKQEQTMLQPMEKKCDTLHRALERWRRRSFQLQKQLNEFVCEQEKCAGARKGRVSQRSVGVCVRMPPLRSAAPSMPTIRTNVSSASIVSSTPTTPASPSRTNTNVGTTVTRTYTAPTVRVLTVPPPGTAAPTALSRLSTQTTSASGTPNVPVPLQLIANTSSPTSQVKSVSLPCTTGSNTVVRTVTMVPSPTAVVTTSAGVKVIDLTQEEDANLARLVAASVSGGSILTNKTTFAVSSTGGAGGTVQKITVPTSAIPMLSAAPTSLVQVSPVSTKNTTHVIATPSVPTSTGAIRIGQPVVQPQRVTYLLPNLSPNMVVNQREGNPRLANSTMSMPTILLRMTTPGNNLGNTISMSGLATQSGSGGNLMVAPPGTQVRMIRAPAPVALQKGGNTFTLPPGTTVVRAPVTIPSAVGTTVVTTKSDHGLPTQRMVISGSAAVDAALANMAKHPAPLPPMPRYLDDPKKKRLPPKPALKITKAASGIVLSWNMTLNSLYADIQTYQLYAYQETSTTPSSSQWKKVGDVRALPLPMACTLTQFVDGHKYHFAVRAVDVHNRLGPFSEPSSILLKRAEGDVP